MDFERYYLDLFEMLNTLCKKIASGKYSQSDSGNAELLMCDISESHPNFKKIRNIKEQVDNMGAITKKLMGISRFATKDYTKGSKIIDIDASS